MALLSVPPFESFYEEHRDAVLGELRRLLGRDRAEDAYQETFLKALRAYLRNADNLRAWVLTIARRVAVDQLRRREAPPLEPEPPIEGRPAYAELGELADELPRRNAPRSCSATATTFPTPPSVPHSARARTPHGRRPRPVSADFEGGCNDRLPLSRQSFPRSRGCGRAARRCVRPHRLSGRDAAVATTERGLCRISFDPSPTGKRTGWPEHSAFVSSGRRSRSTPFAASWTSISQARARGSSCRSTFARPPRSVARS